MNTQKPPLFKPHTNGELTRRIDKIMREYWEQNDPSTEEVLIEISSSFEPGTSEPLTEILFY